MQTGGPQSRTGTCLHDTWGHLQATHGARDQGAAPLVVSTWQQAGCSAPGGGVAASPAAAGTAARARRPALADGGQSDLEAGTKGQSLTRAYLVAGLPVHLGHVVGGALGQGHHRQLDLRAAGDNRSVRWSGG